MKTTRESVLFSFPTELVKKLQPRGADEARNEPYVLVR